MDLQFLPFARLPTEIRIIIWFYAVIPATVYAIPVKNAFRKQENSCLLQVCRESRTVCLQRYQRAPDFEKTYVNFDLDTIYIEWYNHCDLSCHFPMREITSWPQIQYLALDLEWLFKFEMDRLFANLSLCTRLRKATFVVKSTTVKEENEVNITDTITKYTVAEHLEKELYLEQLRDSDIYALDISGQCEHIAKWWAGCPYNPSFRPCKVNCSEISVVFRRREGVIFRAGMPA